MPCSSALNYLGFTDEADQPLDVDNIVGPHTEAALEWFKAVIDPHGAASPLTTTANLDKQTVQWLNAPNSPQWTKYTGAGSPAVASGLNYGTGWLVNAVTRFLSQQSLVGAAQIVHLGPSNPNLSDYANWNSGYLSGMSVAIDVTGFSQNQSQIQQVQASFKDAADHFGMSLVDPDTTHTETPADAPGKTYLRIRILPPEWIMPQESNDLQVALAEVAEGLSPIGQNDLLGKPLPLIGMTTLAQVNDAASVSMDSILNLQQQLSGMFAGDHLSPDDSLCDVRRTSSGAGRKRHQRRHGHSAPRSEHRGLQPANQPYHQLCGHAAGPDAEPGAWTTRPGLGPDPAHLARSAERDGEPPASVLTMDLDVESMRLPGEPFHGQPEQFHGQCLGP